MYYNLGFLLVCMLRLLVQETHTDRRFNCFREWQWWRIGEALQPWTWIFLPHQAPHPGAPPVSAEGPEIPAQSWYLHKALPSAISGQAMQHLIPCWILVTDSLFGFFFHLQMKANTWREKSEYLSLWRKSKKYAKSTWISNQRWHVLIDGESEPRDETGIEKVRTSFYEFQMKKNWDWLIAPLNVWRIIL